MRDIEGDMAESIRQLRRARTRANLTAGQA
jgi:hypothetical protein